MAHLSKSTARARNLAVFAGCVLVWFALDRATKVFFEQSMNPGAAALFQIPGFLSFDLVHNTGAAWGAFSGNALGIGLLTIAICFAVLGFALYESKRGSMVEMVALALVFGGGVGNLFDRLTQGYVTDFITPLFIEFPTFNVADIGVTCGVVLLFIALIIQFRSEQENPTHG